MHHQGTKDEINQIGGHVASFVDIVNSMKSKSDARIRRTLAFVYIYIYLIYSRLLVNIRIVCYCVQEKLMLVVHACMTTHMYTTLYL
jgi:hypothetical protein